MACDLGGSSHLVYIHAVGDCSYFVATYLPLETSETSGFQELCGGAARISGCCRMYRRFTAQQRKVGGRLGAVPNGGGLNLDRDSVPSRVQDVRVPAAAVPSKNERTTFATQLRSIMEPLDLTFLSPELWYQQVKKLLVVPPHGVVTLSNYFIGVLSVNSL